MLLHLTGSHGLAFPSILSSEAVLTDTVVMPSSKYFAYFVDLQGTTRTSYDLQPANDDAP